MKPFQNSPAEWPIVITVAVCVAVVCAYLSSCTLDTGKFGAPGHRIDPAPVVVMGAAGHVRDDDGGAR